MDKERIFELITEDPKLAVDIIYDEIQKAYNTVKIPKAFDMDKKTIKMDIEGTLNTDKLLDFMIENFKSKYFRTLAKKINDYIDGKKKTSPTLDEDFEKFYVLYPKKIKRFPAYKKFKTLNPSTVLVNKILEGLLKQKHLWEKEGREKQYIPAPDVWLNQRRWEDEELTRVSLIDLEKKSSMNRVLE